MNEPNYLKSKRQAACYLGVSTGTLERLMRSGLTYIRVSNLVRFRPEDLAAFIEQRRVSNADAVSIEGANRQAIERTRAGGRAGV
jgi:excisionase family DNA binding protein